MKSFKDIREGRSARDRLLTRLKSKGLDLDKVAKDRKAEHERLKKKYGKNESGKGLWHNIHQKRKSGKPMRKKGEKGAPTKQDIERSRSESTNMDEAPLVMDHGAILDTIWKKVKPILEKDLKNGKVELVNNLARMVKYKVTTKGQAKNRSYRYDLKK
tara:strand:- start:2569 stop:3042 length:474 start_codon:yes stop_codon:yes gene_type:complete